MTERWGYGATRFTPQLLVRHRGEVKPYKFFDDTGPSFSGAKERARRRAGQVEGVLKRISVINEYDKKEVWYKEGVREYTTWNTDSIACSCSRSINDGFLEPTPFAHAVLCPMLPVELASIVIKRYPDDGVDFDTSGMGGRAKLRCWYTTMRKKEGGICCDQTVLSLFTYIPLALQIVEESGFYASNDLVKNYQGPRG